MISQTEAKDTKETGVGSTDLRERPSLNGRQGGGNERGANSESGDASVTKESIRTPTAYGYVGGGSYIVAGIERCSRGCSETSVAYCLVYNPV